MGTLAALYANSKSTKRTFAAADFLPVQPAKEAQTFDQQVAVFKSLGLVKSNGDSGHP